MFDDMITESNSIEVQRTTLSDCKKLFFETLLVGILCGLFAIEFRFYLGNLLVFIVLGLLRPGYLQILCSPYKFEFKDGLVRFCFWSFRGEEKEETIPYECFVFVKMNWHQKGNQAYSVNYWDNRKKNYYSFCMPTLSKMNHWDEEALDYLLSLADQNGVTIKNWDYPIRWGR